MRATMTIQLTSPPSPLSPKAFALGYELSLVPTCWDSGIGLWLDAGVDPSEIWIDASLKEFTPTPTQARKKLRDCWTVYSLELCDDIEHNVTLLVDAPQQGPLEGVRNAIRHFRETTMQCRIKNKEPTRDQALFLSQLIAAKGQALETRLGGMDLWYKAGLILGECLRDGIASPHFLGASTMWPDSLFVGLLNAAACIHSDSSSLYFPRLNLMLGKYMSTNKQLQSGSALAHTRSVIAEEALDIYRTVCIEAPEECGIKERGVGLVTTLRSSVQCVKVIRGILERIRTDLEQSVAKAVSGESGSARPDSIPGVMRDAETEARDKYIYEECCKGTKHSTIQRHVKGQWSSSSLSINGIRDAAKRYARRHKLPMPPPRQVERKQQKKPDSDKAPKAR